MEITVAGRYYVVRIVKGSCQEEYPFHDINTALRAATKMAKEDGNGYGISWQFDISDHKRLYAKIYYVDSKCRSRLPGTIFYMDDDDVVKIGNYFGSRAKLRWPWRIGMIF